MIVATLPARHGLQPEEGAVGGAGGRDQEAAAAAASPDQPPDYNHVAVQRGGKMESPPPCYEDAVKGAVL